MKTIRVVYFTRKPGKGQISIERLFASVRANLPATVRGEVCRCPFARGVIGRVANLLHAALRQGEVNHITGDVHYLALFLRGRRTILTVHDCARLHVLKGLRLKVYRKLWFDWPARRAGRVTAISAFTREELIRLTGCPPEKIRVIHDLIGDEFHHVPRPFNAACPTILLVGTAANKNLERVAEALQGLACRLRIVGRLSPEQTELLRALQLSYENVHDIGDAELFEEYVRCDMVVFASTYEGFGLPILEAHAVGRPVVTSSVASMPEVAGDAALLVDPFAVADIRRAVQQVIADGSLRERLVQAGLGNIKRFAPRRIVGQYLELYREIADGAGQ